MIDKEKLKRRFSRNAKHYSKYASVQKKMGDMLVKKLVDEHLCFKRILEIGCGTGYVTQALAEHFPAAAITAVDIAPGMIEHIKSTLQYDNVEFICGDIEEMTLNGKYDLIISNATFQWFNHLDKTLVKLAKLLDKNGVLCFSTFGQNTFIELYEAFEKAKELLNISEAVSPGQSFYSLNALQDICKNIVTDNHLDNMEIFSTECYEYEYFDGCTDFLYSIKKIGANNSQSSGSNMIHGFIEKVIELYDRDFMVSYKEKDKVRATYHNIFVYMKFT